DVWVYTRWDVPSLRAALAEGDPALYLLTNSRGLPASAAAALNGQAARELMTAARAAERNLLVVSRSDSTLRGHFPVEVDALRQALETEQGAPFDGVCLIPAFPEAGRFTIGDVQWVAEGDTLYPAAQTPYARDDTFGFQHSVLPRWIEEKTRGRVRADEVVCISLEHLRVGGPSVVADLLQKVTGGRCVVVNAAAYADLDLFVAGLRQALSAGKRFLFRSAAPFIKTLAGLEDRPLLTAAEIVAGRAAGGGLILFGSHVPKSTAQLEQVRALPHIHTVELCVRRVLHEAERQREVLRVVRSLNAALAQGSDALLFTSREVVRGTDADDSLAIARAVSSALTEVCAGVRPVPRYLLGKGGITSSDLASRGLNAARARVLGQVLPGVPVWRPDGGRWPGIPFVVFPGNVGEHDAVAAVVQMLRP
ncbi:MAG: four-carbon acid sugar kinase family protein, partial [Armatimonadota bacterium]|nr:four-carbon acid sugar kinase family protein [Armatimonadota bacterium]